jgi:hypothetical protein
MFGSSLFRKKPKPGNAGDEYLNWEFGWKPLIADFKKFLYAYKKTDQLWDQFLRDSGRRVRRRYTFPKFEEVSSTVVLDQVLQGPGLLQPSLYAGSGTFPRYEETNLSRERWFSGAFTYLAEVEDSQHKSWKRDLQRFNYLYGVKITPEVLWNLAPWSWAADWFANTGNIMTNISRFSSDSLVMPYGYMMEKSILKKTYRIKDVRFKSQTIPDLTQTFTHTVKYRRKATPYGFGLDEGTFTPRQWAIIAALGLSRSR